MFSIPFSNLIFLQQTNALWGRKYPLMDGSLSKCWKCIFCLIERWQKEYTGNSKHCPALDGNQRTVLNSGDTTILQKNGVNSIRVLGESGYRCSNSIHFTLSHKERPLIAGVANVHVGDSYPYTICSFLTSSIAFNGPLPFLEKEVLIY